VASRFVCPVAYQPLSRVALNKPRSIAIFAAIRRGAWQSGISDFDLSRAFTVGRLRGPAIAEVAMKTASVIVLIATVLVVGSTLSIMNRACKSGYHARMVCSDVHRAASF
jgi:hypothetical protein